MFRLRDGFVNRLIRALRCRSLSAETENQELLERSSLMEKILSQRVTGIRFDLESLRQAAADSGRLSNGCNLSDSGPDEEEDVHIEDEKCTIDPVEDTVTRMVAQRHIRTILT